MSIDEMRKLEMNKRLPTVAVIMSSFNGEKYIREQIESVLKQTYPRITLYIRDDGSTDQTRYIVKECMDSQIVANFRNASTKEDSYNKAGDNNGTDNSFRKIISRKGKNKGFIKSFFSALKECPDADYYAWCDQDDIWVEDKVERAVTILEKRRLNNVGAVPLLYFSSFDFYDEDMKLLKHGPQNNNGPSFANSLVDCIPLGFNSVFNHEARRMMIEKTPGYSCGHDWWTYMVCSAFGDVIYDKGYVSVKYRRTRDSISPAGMNCLKKRFWQFRKFYINNYFKNVRMQLLEFSQYYLSYLEKGDPQKAKLLGLFSSGRYSVLNAARKAFYPGRFRQNITDEIVVRVLFLIGML